MRDLLRRPPALLVAVLVLLAASAALSATRTSPRTLERAAAVRAVLQHPKEARALARGERWTRVEVSAVDATTTRVTFYDGARILAQAAVRPDGSVERFADVRDVEVPYGVPLTYLPLTIAAGALAFLLATAVVPLRRLRNLDVLALLAFIAPVVLLQQRYATASTLAAVPSLLWLAGRCAWRALGPQRPPSPSRPLLDALTPAWSGEQRVRILRLAVGVAAACTAMVTVSAQTTVDVGQAVMEGATLLVHGTLPYGNMPGDVFHGDVYPLLGYAVYMPLALPMPVRDAWDVANGALVVAALAAVAGAGLIARLARDTALRTPAGADGEAGLAVRAAGLRAALALLTLPPLLIAASTGTSDVLLGTLLLAALVLVRRPLASTALVLVAGWFKVVPFALLPIWLARLRGRRLVVALSLTAGSAALTLAALVALGGASAPGAMLRAVAYQVERRTLHAPLTLLGLDWLQPLAQAAVLALIAGATVRVRRDAGLANDPARLAALGGAVLLGLQLTANYWTFLYLAWVAPCAIASLLADAPAAVRLPVRAPGLNPLRRNADKRAEAAPAAAPLPS